MKLTQVESLAIAACPAALAPEEREEIITHEYIHASQWHSVDVIATEWICILCWMNPFAWLLRREVKLNLEYLADKGVLQSGFDSKAYQYLLVGLAGYNQAAAHLYNNFNVLPLKNRISMMNKKRSSAIARTKYLICIPLAALLVLLGNMSACSSGAKTGEAEIEEVMVTGKAVAPIEPQPEVSTNGNREIFTIVEEMPRFPGSDKEMMEYLFKTTHYPESAQEKGIQGRVTVQFVVNEDGSISDAVVMRGVDPLLDKEALRVVNTMPNWTPGKQGGKVVPVKFTVPITFRLQ
ncbi:hypothetical protein FACS189435_4690 [Bacteroidia bacterium]|nr:hypothetical protein FACS189435_4690 [Bacteroidia bacterium]